MMIETKNHSLVRMCSSSGIRMPIERWAPSEYSNRERLDVRRGFAWFGVLTQMLDSGRAMARREGNKVQYGVLSMEPAHGALERLAARAARRLQRPV
jgi:hypothetical protein